MRESGEADRLPLAVTTEYRAQGQGATEISASNATSLDFGTLAVTMRQAGSRYRRLMLERVTFCKRQQQRFGNLGAIDDCDLTESIGLANSNSGGGTDDMRFIPNIRFGTEPYPEHVARRLRATNIVTWFGAGSVSVFVVLRFLDGSAHWKYAALVALLFCLVPLLHRFNAAAAPFAVVVIAYTWIFFITLIVGTESGATYYYLAGAALGLLLLGAEHVTISILVAAGAAVAMITLRFVAPQGVGAPPLVAYGNFIINSVGSAALLYAIVFYAMRQLMQAEQRADHERQRSERLLANILPPDIAERLKVGSDETIADAFPEASILFADMGGFTSLSSDITPQELVLFLNRVYTKLDSLVDQHGLEKIKSSGDAYMVVSGVPRPIADHAQAIAGLALEMRDSLKGLVDPKGRHVPIRIGIASGPVVAGVVGTSKFFYDVWGDAVNIASRMESSGEPGKIQLALATRQLLEGRFAFEERGVIDVRGKGPMQTFFLTGRIELQAPLAAVASTGGAAHL